MKPKNALIRFKQLLPADRTFSAGLDAMLGFYESERFGGACIEDGGDMLLFQWGTYNWGHREHFEIDITRQLIWDPRGWITKWWFTKLLGHPSIDYQAIWQLSHTLRFAPTSELRKLKSGNQWCSSPEHLQEFNQFILDHKVYQAVGNRVDGEFSLTFGDAE